MKVKTVTFEVCDSGISETISKPSDAIAFLKSAYLGFDAGQEHFVLLALSSSNAIVGFKHLSSGGVDASIVDPRIVFRAAFALGAAAIIVCHNHPSGNPSPSPEDVKVTKRLREGGEILGIKVVDHIIIAGDKYMSFAEEGV